MGPWPINSELQELGIRQIVLKPLLAPSSSREEWQRPWQEERKNSFACPNKRAIPLPCTAPSPPQQKLCGSTDNLMPGCGLSPPLPWRFGVFHLAWTLPTLTGVHFLWYSWSVTLPPNVFFPVGTRPSLRVLMERFHWNVEVSGDNLSIPFLDPLFYSPLPPVGRGWAAP